MSEPKYKQGDYHVWGFNRFGSKCKTIVTNNVLGSEALGKSLVSDEDDETVSYIIVRVIQNSLEGE